MARKVTDADRKRLEAYRKKRNEMYQEGVLQRAEEKKHHDDMRKAAEAENKEFDKKVAKQQKENELLGTTVDLSQKLIDQYAESTGAQKKQVGVQQEVLDTMKARVKEGKMDEDVMKSQVSLMEQIADGTATTSDLQSELRHNSENMTPEFKKYVEQQVKFNQAQDLSKGIMGELDGALGTNLGALSEFAALASNPIAMGVAVFGALVKLLADFSERVDQIGEEFGVMGVKELSFDIQTADNELLKLGYDAGTTAEIMGTLGDEFGISLTASKDMAVQIGDMSKALGLSTETGSKLMGTFMTMGGMTAQQAEDTSKMAYQLAAANDVHPGAVLEDIAGSTEAFAKYGKDGGKNLIEASVIAKKLGTNLEDVASTMESMLDFQGSIEKAMNASVMLGRDINIQKLQELSLAGDAKGVLEEQKRLLGDANKWESMNTLERQALAEAIGLSVDKAAQMVNKQEEAVTLQGELAKQPGFEDLVGKEAISSMAKMMGTIKSIGAQLTTVIGPILNVVLSLINGILWVFTGVSDFVGMIAGTLATWSEYLGPFAFLLKSVAYIMVIMAAYGAYVSLSWIPVVGSILGAIAAAAVIAAGFTAISQAGDMVSPADGKTMVSTKEGGLFEMSENDDLVAGPGVAGAVGGGSNMGAVVNAIASLKAEVSKVVQENANLRKDMQGYLGMGGTAIKGIGRATTDALADAST